METYSFSATVPTFGMILKYCVPRSFTRDVISDVEMGIRNKIHTFSSHLGQLWLMPDRPTTGHTSGQRSQGISASPATSQQPDLAMSDDPTVHIMPASTPHHLASVGTHAPQNPPQPPTSDPFLSTPWLRATQNIDESGLLPTPTPSMTTVAGGSEVSGQPGQLEASLRTGMRPSLPGPSKSQNAPPMIPDLTPAFPPGQYPTQYQDHSLGLSPFAGLDSFGAPRRQQRIAPDLDALFDELASLDGAEK